jgi:cytochrome c peroxidase
MAGIAGLMTPSSQSINNPHMPDAGRRADLSGDDCVHRKSPGMLRRSASPNLSLRRKEEIVRPANRWRWGMMACALVLGGGLLLSSAIPQPLAQPPEANSIISEEPITPILSLPSIDPLKVRLGERLFGDPRLSRDNSRSCSSCHDLGSNGATKVSQDPGLDGSTLPLNTLTVFNAALSFRFGWEGKIRTLESDVAASLQNPQIMGADIAETAEKLNADPALSREFMAAYGSGADARNVIDALASFQRTLMTPGSRFDRWLMGDAGALSAEEQDGYRLFKSLGCVSCHQGVNIGGNLFQRHGIFHPLASPKPEVLRVPSLRNVAATAPYFHDGSAATLDDAVRKMGMAQLNSTLTNQQVSAIVAYLQTLTGKYHGVPVGGAP